MRVEPLFDIVADWERDVSETYLLFEALELDADTLGFVWASDRLNYWPYFCRQCRVFVSEDDANDHTHRPGETPHTLAVNGEDGWTWEN